MIRLNNPNDMINLNKKTQQILEIFLNKGTLRSSQVHTELSKIG